MAKRYEVEVRLPYDAYRMLLDHANGRAHLLAYGSRGVKSQKMLTDLGFLARVPTFPDRDAARLDIRQAVNGALHKVQDFIADWERSEETEKPLGEASRYLEEAANKVHRLGETRIAITDAGREFLAVVEKTKGKSFAGAIVCRMGGEA